MLYGCDIALSFLLAVFFGALAPNFLAFVILVQFAGFFGAQIILLAFGSAAIYFLTKYLLLAFGRTLRV